MADFTLDESTIYWLSIAILIAALLIIATSVFFGRILYQEAIRKFLDHLDRFTDPAKLLDAFREFLERTNDFWTTYGQIALATFIVAVLAVLLLTRTISSEAGLPILSAIASFAIAKGASVSRSPPASPSGSEVPPDSSGDNDKSKEVGQNEGSPSSIQKSSSINAEKKNEVVGRSSSDDNKAAQGVTPMQEPVNDDQGGTKRGKIEDHGTWVNVDGASLKKRVRRLLGQK